VQPLIVPCSFTVARDAVQPVVRIGDTTVAVPMPDTGGAIQAPMPVPDPSAWTGAAGTASVPLVRLAWGRSGDKGDLSNIGLIARRPEWLPLLWQQVTPAAVAAWMGHLAHGKVERFHLPGIAAMNLVLHEALDGGGPVSLRLDPLGKGMAQILLDMPIQVPADIVASLA
jgi:hypothetical protein